MPWRGFPGFWGRLGGGGVFERVRDMAREEVRSASRVGSESGVGGIHGDFWTGK